MSSSSSVSTTALSALLSSLNNGSAGLDVTDSVAAIIEADSTPITNWEADQTSLGNQTTAIEQLESEAGDVTTALQSLNDATGVFDSVTAASTSTAVSVSAATGASIGTHTVSITNLAKAASAYSEEESSSSSTLPSGSFAITQNGTTTSFSTGSGTTGDNLTDLAAQINSSGVGVTASVITDSGGSRLSLVSSSTGAAANFTVSGSSGMSFTQANTGTDASLEVDGVPITSASNTVTSAIPGVTLNLNNTTTSTGTATVTIGSDSNSIESAVSSFVSAYNTLVTDLNTQFTFSSTTNSQGVLSSDSVTRSLQNDVLGMSTISTGSGIYNTLSSLGISTNSDGTLSIDDDVLSTAISTDPQDVQSFFQGNGSTTGFANSVINTLNNYTDAADGSFTVDLQNIASENTSLQGQIDDYQVYLATEQTLLTTEYNNANIELQQLPSQIKNTQILLGEDSSSGSN